MKNRSMMVENFIDAFSEAKEKKGEKKRILFIRSSKNKLFSKRKTKVGGGLGRSKANLKGLKRRLALNA